jgi:hypothetical protein
MGEGLEGGGEGGGLGEWEKVEERAEEEWVNGSRRRRGGERSG